MLYSNIIECFDPPVKKPLKQELKLIKQQGQKVKAKKPKVLKKPKKPEKKGDLPPPPQTHQSTKNKEVNYYYRNYYFDEGYPRWWLDRYYPSYDYPYYNYLYGQPTFTEPTVIIQQQPQEPTKESVVPSMNNPVNMLFLGGSAFIGILLLIIVIFLIMKK